MGQQTIGIRFGKPTANSIAVVGCSLSSGNITVTVNGASTTITLSQLGTDHTADQAGFVGDATISGLTAYTKYNYTATQGSNSVSGYFWTAPESDDDFILIPITCDNNTSNGGVPAGGYSKVKSIAAENPGKGVYFLHIDDHLGYLDSNLVDDGGIYAVSDPIGPTNTAKVFDYALGAFAAFGLYGESGNAYCTWGHNADRIWCMQNIPVLCQWGDHDAGDDDMGWDIDPAGAGGPPTAADKYTNCKSVYDAFCQPFAGTDIDGANSKAWEHGLGCIKIIAPDGITQASGDGGTPAQTDMPTTVFGSTQIGNLITACDDEDYQFKIMPMMYGIRYLDDNGHEFNDGAQHAIGGNPTFTGGAPTAAHADYAELFTDAGGLMTKASCNGRQGVFMTVHGDWHGAKVVRNRSTAGANDEWFYSISVGTINGCVNFETSGITVDTPVDESTPEMVDGTALGHDWWVVPFYVYGSREIKEIEISFLDKDGTELWLRKFTARSMNDAVAIDANVSANGSSGVSGAGLGQ